MVARTRRERPVTEVRLLPAAVAQGSGKSVAESSTFDQNKSVDSGLTRQENVCTFTAELIQERDLFQ